MGGLGRLQRVVAAGVLVSGQLVWASTAQVPAGLVTSPKLVGSGGAFVASPATMVSAVTGRASVNRTDERWQIKGTDLGILWEGSSGDVMAAFGDTFGRQWTGHDSTDTPAVNGWRSNTLARSQDRDLTDGMTVDRFTADAARPRVARELLSSRKVEGDEMTVIPTAGIAVGSRDYVLYMSVQRWIAHGEWTTNGSGIAWSDDGGETWVKDRHTVWPNDPGEGGNFQMGAFARATGFLYLYGTPAGRGGDVRLARVPAGNVLDPTAYRYWEGAGWSDDVADATPVVGGPVGEMSVQYNAYLDRWVMLHVHSPEGSDLRAIVLRTAPEPEGPWSPPQEIATSRDHPGLYGGFIHPWSAASGEADLYFTMSLWEPYNVYLMRTTLALHTMG